MTLELASNLGWHLGLLAGVGAISLGIYIQAVYRFAVPPAYTLGMYAFGSVIVVFHLEPGWATPAVHEAMQLIAWSLVIAAEILLLWDVHNRFEVLGSVIEGLNERINERGHR